VIILFGWGFVYRDHLGVAWMKSEEPVRGRKLNESDARLRKAETDDGILISFHLNAGLA
jgi:hypothetical protein